MVLKYNRAELSERLARTRREGRLIIAAGAGTGLSAKCAEAGGADLILVFNSGRFRMDGHGSLSGLLAFGNANEIALEMGERQVLPVVKETPVICSVHAADPTRCMERHLEEVMKRGFSGINNFPTAGLIDGNFRRMLEATNLGYAKEVELVKLAAAKDIFAIVYAFNVDEAVAMARAGADAVVVHVGLTVGGTIGGKESLTIVQAAELTMTITQACKEINPRVLILAHGGPLSTPRDLREFLSLAPVDGFVGASSMERLPTERAITETVREFKTIG